MHSKEITAMHPALAEWLNEDQFFLEDITNVHIFVHFKNETAEIGI